MSFFLEFDDGRSGFSSGPFGFARLASTPEFGRWDGGAWNDGRAVDRFLCGGEMCRVGWPVAVGLTEGGRAGTEIQEGFWQGLRGPIDDGCVNFFWCWR